jgi:PAS domain S-box-containing protein
MTTSDTYRWFFLRSPMLATLINSDGRYEDVNEAIAARLGYTREQMIGHRPAEFVTPDTATRIEKEFVPALRRTGRLENKPVTFVARSGEKVECLTTSIAEAESGSGQLRNIAIYNEVSDAARADWKYRELYRATPAMLHIVDANGCIVTVTDHWLRKMGYQREEVVGRSIMDFLSEKYRKELGDGKLRHVISLGELNNENRQMVTRDGRVIDLVMSAISERDANGNVVRMLVASKDVTERNRAERELRDALAENARLRQEIENERDYLREEVSVSMNLGRLVGSSPALSHVLDQISAVSQTPANVLILGESGVGKELVARAIHARSPRSEFPLVKVNCASIPKELFESEFFGHVKGAFTGAHRDRIGRFQLADGGSLFLDEVGEIPLELQGKLLRVLQESEFERVGDDQTRRVDVRVIAATNRNLEEAIVKGKFREDLFYRLSVFPIEVPPLRKRGDDVIQLAQQLLTTTCQEFGRNPMRLTRAQAEMLKGYSWPGNVRELKNVIERAVILSPGNALRLDLSMPVLSKAGRQQALVPERPAVEVHTDAHMRKLLQANMVAAMEKTNWRVSGKGGAAELLGLRPTTLTDRLKAYGIRKPVRK